MQVEDARLICPCMVHCGPERESARSAAGRERSARMLVVALVLATATLGFSVVTPVESAVVTMDRRATGLVKLDINPAQVPTLATGMRGEFSTVVSANDLDEVRREYFESKIPFGALIYREAIRNGLEPELVAAVVRVESGFYPDNVSVKNAIGLMQLIPSTGELMGASDLTDPEQNVRAGTKYLKYLVAEFEGDEVLTLAAYNAGAGTVRRYDGVPPYRETQEYIRKVGRFRYAYARKIDRAAAVRAVDVSAP
jgi:soluble lytic murein transglycosylase-like protein